MCAVDVMSTKWNGYDLTSMAFGGRSLGREGGQAYGVVAVGERGKDNNGWGSTERMIGVARA